MYSEILSDIRHEYELLSYIVEWLQKILIIF